MVWTRLQRVGFFMFLSFYLVLAYCNYHFSLDDGLIYLRYIRNLVDGLGLVYNPGERFNGLTSPLFSYLTAALALVTRSPGFAQWLLCTVSIFAADATLFLLLLEENRRPGSIGIPDWSVAAGFALALASPYFFATFGMETGLFVFFCAAVLRTYQKRQWTRYAMLAALLVLTRSEGVFLVAATLGHHLLTRRSLPPFGRLGLATAAGLIGAVLLFNTLYYHAPWPGTGMAKIFQGRSGLWGEMDFLDVRKLYGMVFLDRAYYAVIVGAFAAAGVIALGASALNGIILVFLFLYGSFFVLLRIPGYHWYYGPYLFFMPFYAAAGFGYLVQTLLRGDPGVRSKLFAGALVALFVVPVAGFVGRDLTIKGDGSPDYRKAGLWIRENTPPDASIAMVEIGTIGWYSQRRVIDILGLVNPDNAMFVGERKFDAWMDEYHPDYLLVHSPAWGHEVSFYSFVSRCTLVQQCGLPATQIALYKVDYKPSPSRFCDGRRFDRVQTTLVDGKGDDAGWVDSASPLGNFVQVTGWATDGHGRAFTGLALSPGAGFSFGSVQVVDRPDVTAAIHAPGHPLFGFVGALRFENAEQAAAFAKEPRLMALRADHAAPALIHFGGRS